MKKPDLNYKEKPSIYSHLQTIILPTVSPRSSIILQLSAIIPERFIYQF